MKTRSRHPHDTLQAALRSAFRLDARRLEVFCALILAMIQARSVVLYTLKTHVNLPGSLETRYQRLLSTRQFFSRRLGQLQELDQGQYLFVIVIRLSADRPYQGS